MSAPAPSSSDDTTKPSFAAIPAELRAERRWVADKRKIPPSDWDIPATWATLDEVVRRIDAPVSPYTHPGFVIGDGFVGADLDKVRDPATGELTPNAQAILAWLGTYAEVSMSGTGVKAIGRGTLSAPLAPTDLPGGGTIELYSSGRQFALTGDAFNSHGIADLDGKFEDLRAQVAGPAVPSSNGERFEPATDVIGEGRNIYLTKYAGRWRNHCTVDEVRALVLVENDRVCRPPLPEGEIDTTIMQSVRGWEQGPPPSVHHHVEGAPAMGAKPTKPSTIRLVSATTVKPANVDWAYEGRVPLGMVTLLVGQGEAGKSLLTHRLAAGFSRGTVRGQFFGTPVHVAIASAEDNRGSVIIPRLIAAGADLDYIHFIEELDGEGEPDDIALDGQVAGIEATLREASVRILIADTVVAHIPTAHDTYKEQHVRRVLKPLTHMAERLDLAVLGVMHLNRRETRDILTRISGSGGFGNLARSVLLFAKDPDDEEGTAVRYLSHPKCNVGPHAPTLRMHIEGAVVKADGVSIITAVVVDEGESDITAAHLLGAVGDGDASAVDEAESFLREVMAYGGPVPAKAAIKDAGAMGIGSNALTRARKRLGIESHKVGFDGWEWTWSDAARGVMKP